MPGSQIVDLIVRTSRKQGQENITLKYDACDLGRGGAFSLFSPCTFFVSVFTIFAHYYLGAWNSLSTLQLLIQTLQPTSVKNVHKNKNYGLFVFFSETLMIWRRILE